MRRNIPDGHDSLEESDGCALRLVRCDLARAGAKETNDGLDRVRLKLTCNP